MAMTIVADECISCGDCEPVCPTKAISEGIWAYRIAKNACTECEGEDSGPHCIAVCPVEQCIVPLVV